MSEIVLNNLILFFIAVFPFGLVVNFLADVLFCSYRPSLMRMDSIYLDFAKIFLHSRPTISSIDQENHNLSRIAEVEYFYVDGDIFKTVLLHYFGQKKIFKAQVLDKYEIIQNLQGGPYLIVQERETKEVFALFKNSPDFILSKCKKIMVHDQIRDLAEGELSRMVANHENEKKFAVHSVAYALKPLPKKILKEYPKEYVESDLVYLGQVNFGFNFNDEASLVVKNLISNEQEKEGGRLNVFLVTTFNRSGADRREAGVNQYGNSAVDGFLVKNGLQSMKLVSQVDGVNYFDDLNYLQEFAKKYTATKRFLPLKKNYLGHFVLLKTLNLGALFAVSFFWADFLSVLILFLILIICEIAIWRFVREERALTLEIFKKGILNLAILPLGVVFYLMNLGFGVFEYSLLSQNLLLELRSYVVLAILGMAFLNHFRLSSVGQHYMRRNLGLVGLFGLAAGVSVYLNLLDFSIIQWWALFFLFFFLFCFWNFSIRGILNWFLNFSKQV